MNCGTPNAADTTVESRQHSTHSLALFKNRAVRLMVFSSPYTTSVFSSLKGPLVPMLLNPFGILVSEVVPTLFRLTKISARSYIKPLVNYLYIINLILQIIYFFKESLVEGISLMLQTHDFKMAPLSEVVQSDGNCLYVLVKWFFADSASNIC
jgi:hypothetical protein